MFWTRPTVPADPITPARTFPERLQVQLHPFYSDAQPQKFSGGITLVERDPALRKAALDAVCAWERGDAAALAKAMEAVKGALVT